MAELVAVDEDLWCATQPLRFLGMELGARMSVVKLPNGALWLHSPIDPTPGLRAAVEALGPVRHVVAPNRFHHLFAGRWGTPAEGVRIHVAPGLLAKRPDLAAAGAEELGAAPAPEWGGVIEQHAIGGMPWVNEVAFLHRPSRTLLSCDLAFRIGSEAPGWTRWNFRMMRAYGRLATTPVEWALTRDRAAARASLEHVLDWDFDRIVVGHGTIQEEGGREALRRAWGWVLPS